MHKYMYINKDIFQKSKTIIEKVFIWNKEHFPPPFSNTFLFFFSFFHQQEKAV